MEVLTKKNVANGIEGGIMIATITSRQAKTRNEQKVDSSSARFAPTENSNPSRLDQNL